MSAGIFIEIVMEFLGTYPVMKRSSNPHFGGKNKAHGVLFVQQNYMGCTNYYKGRFSSILVEGRAKPTDAESWPAGDLLKILNELVVNTFASQTTLFKYQFHAILFMNSTTDS